MDNLFRIKSTYYSFLSGALSSFSFSIIYDAAKVISNRLYWMSGFIMLISSILVIVISVKVEQSFSVYEENKKRKEITHKTDAQYFSEAIQDNRNSVLFMLILSVALFCLSIFLFAKGGTPA